MYSPYHDTLRKPHGDPDETNAPDFQQLTPAGAYLCQRYLVRPVIADLVALIAGLGDRRALQ